LLGALPEQGAYFHQIARESHPDASEPAARPEQAVPLYEEFILQLKKTLPSKVQTGVFGADMQIELLNDGPVTILIDSKVRE
jgi:D-tyrosyl-tRNA(Tyr) deacylase